MRWMVPSATSSHGPADASSRRHLELMMTNETSPDLSQDVIVRFTVDVDSPGGARRASWTIRLGTVPFAAIDDDESAKAYARRAARLYDRPAWLLGRDGSGWRRLR